MTKRLTRFLAPALAAGAVAVTGCGDRSEPLATDEAVTTQNAADAVVTDLTEDAQDLTAAAQNSVAEGAAEAGQELEQAGQRLENSLDAARD